MNIAVLGGGMVGSFIAAELSKKYNLKLYDRENLNVDNVESVVMDTTSDDFKDEIRNYDLAVNIIIMMYDGMLKPYTIPFILLGNFFYYMNTFLIPNSVVR